TRKLATARGKSSSVLMSPGAERQALGSAPAWQRGSPGAHRRRHTAPSAWLVADGNVVIAVKISDSGSGIWFGLLTLQPAAKPICSACSGGGAPKATSQASVAAPRPWLRSTRGQ